MAFVNKAVNKDSMIAPTRIQIIPNIRPRNVFGVLSPYLTRKIKETRPSHKEEEKALSCNFKKTGLGIGWFPTAF